MIQGADLVDLATEALILALILSIPILLAALLAGIITSGIQMITKVGEPLTGQVIRIVAISLGLYVFSPWIGGRLTAFADRVWSLVQTVSL